MKNVVLILAVILIFGCQKKEDPVPIYPIYFTDYATRTGDTIYNSDSTSYTVNLSFIALSKGNYHSFIIRDFGNHDTMDKGIFINNLSSKVVFDYKFTYWPKSAVGKWDTGKYCWHISNRDNGVTSEVRCFYIQQER